MASDLNIGITVSSSSVVLGGSVDAVVHVGGEPDRRTRQVKAQLVRIALERVFDKGKSTTEWRHVVVETPIAFPSGWATAGDYPVRLTVPSDDLPSAAGQVSWTAKVLAERHLGRDVTAEVPFTVLSGPDRFPTEAVERPSYPYQPGIDLELSTRILRPGDTIEGKVVLRPVQPMSCDKVTVDFIRRVGAAGGHTSESLPPQTLLNEPITLQPGEIRALPFALTLPPDAAPTVLGQTSTGPPLQALVKWLVAGWARIDARSTSKDDSTDHVAQYPVLVYNAPSPPAQG